MHNANKPLQFSIQTENQRQEIDALFSYLNELLSPSNGLSVVVDDSHLGHDAIIQVVKKCSESGREIVGHYILKGDVKKEAMLTLHLHHSNNLFAGIGQKSFLQMINMTEEMGLASYNHILRIFMMEKSIAGITEICYKPMYNYFIADNQLPPSFTTYIVNKVNECWESNDKMSKNARLERLVKHF